MEWDFHSSVKDAQRKPTSKIICKKSMITQDGNQERIVISSSNNSVLEFPANTIMENKTKA